MNEEYYAEPQNEEDDFSEDCLQSNDGINEMSVFDTYSKQIQQWRSPQTKPTSVVHKVYGIDYAISDILCTKPKAELLTLEQPTIELVTEKKFTSLRPDVTTVKKREDKIHPVPTYTERCFDEIQVDYTDIPQLCERCYAIKCQCAVLFKHQDLHESS